MIDKGCGTLNRVHLGTCWSTWLSVILELPGYGELERSVSVSSFYLHPWNHQLGLIKHHFWRETMPSHYVAWIELSVAFAIHCNHSHNNSSGNQSLNIPTPFLQGSSLLLQMRGDHISPSAWAEQEWHTVCQRCWGDFTLCNAHTGLPFVLLFCVWWV